MRTVSPVHAEDILQTAAGLRQQIGGNFHDQLAESSYTEAARIADRAVTWPADSRRFDLSRTIDRVVTSRVWGFPLMIALFSLVFWITIEGANVPSAMLAALLIDAGHPFLKGLAATIGMPWWLDGLLIDGMYLTTAWVISVMLPPMAIFFPLFTLLEDLGYLPRVAFNLDNLFKKAGAHGKQSLSMMMGFGCNAAGIVATRVIDSPRERLIAMVTNNFALCNGRWSTQILVATVFLGALAPPYLAGFVSAMTVVGVALFGVLLTFLISWALSRTLLKGEASTFSLELPPYRPPNVWQTIYSSLIDRTLFVLWRAMVFALPAGAIIWLSANVVIGDASLAGHLVDLLQPPGWLMGLNGIIMLAYLVAIPANEIVIPTILMLIVLVTGQQELGAGAGVMFELGADQGVRAFFDLGSWTLLTAINLMLFSLIHNPCSTTIYTMYTMYKETKSAKWTALAALLPLALGIIVTMLVAAVWRLFG